ncbi:MAG TPA: DinB family protein [Pyrinomonadaceae bacterium]|nr:DinB family protein [Pyrinomonadaceae bacterium]
MGRDKAEICSELQRVADEARSTFGSLSAVQLNWKSAEKAWSIAQCFDHLITTHSLYFPLFERLANGDVAPTFWERNSPLSGFFGRFLIKSLRPENTKKRKTTAKAEPSKSEIGGDIIQRYVEHQRQMIEHLESVPTNIDPMRTIVTSPLLGVVTYSLDDTYTILAVHSQRHLGQAERVLETEEFPTS